TFINGSWDSRDSAMILRIRMRRSWKRSRWRGLKSGRIDADKLYSPAAYDVLPTMQQYALGQEPGSRLQRSPGNLKAAASLSVHEVRPHSPRFRLSRLHLVSSKTQTEITHRQAQDLGYEMPR